MLRRLEHICRGVLQREGERPLQTQTLDDLPVHSEKVRQIIIPVLIHQIQSRIVQRIVHVGILTKPSIFRLKQINQIALLIFVFYVWIQHRILTKTPVWRIFCLYPRISQLITEREILVNVLQFQTQAQTFTTGLLHHARRVVVVHLHRITDVIISAVQPKGMLVCHRHLVQRLVQPISIHAFLNIFQTPVVSILHHHLIIRAATIIIILFQVHVIQPCQHFQLQLLLRITQIIVAQIRHIERHVPVVADCHLPAGRRIRRNDHHAIRSTGTVNCRRCRILQQSDTCHPIRVHIKYFFCCCLKAIHNKDRHIRVTAILITHTADASSSTDLKLRNRIRIRTQQIVFHLHKRRVNILQRRQDVLVASRLQLLRRNGAGCTRKTVLRLVKIPCHHHILQFCRIFFHHHVDFRAGSHFHFLCFHPYH